ncbi:hypothetical protein PMAYCL1PPCAC_16086, partial [Pristionchus mayeri]
MDEGKKIQIAGLFEFVQATFPEFQVLNTSDKWLLIRNYSRSFSCLDSAFRVLRTFGRNSNVIFGSYTTYLSWDCLYQYLPGPDCPDQSNVEIAEMTLHETFQLCVSMKNAICRCNISEEEFCALMALAFWSFENIDVCEELQQLAVRYRTSIIAELTTRYRETIGEENGASRIGSLMCVLQEVRNLAENLTTSFEIFRILGVFNDDTVIYK